MSHTGAPLDRIPLAGVIGAPIAHSKSPRLHGHWLRKYGIAGHYIPMEIAPDKLAEALRLLPELGFVGVNVTIPYKVKVLELADLVTDRATLIGAANTLIFRRDGKIHADNTDGYGFLENLRHGAPDWDPRSGPATVLGAGGAARAVIASLLDVGVPAPGVGGAQRPTNLEGAASDSSAGSAGISALGNDDDNAASGEESQERFCFV